MKYYKSKRGYFYKMVGDKKTRISIEEYKSMKGGLIESNGILEENDFDIPKTLKKNGLIFNNKHKVIELQNSFNINFCMIPEPKILRKAGLSHEPYIFFGYNPITGKYRYVFYNDTRWFKHNEIIIPNNANMSYKKEVICKTLIDSRIIEINHSRITTIRLKYLVHLYLFLLNKRETEPYFMERLFTYLYNIIKYKITKSGKTQYNNRIPLHNEIKFLPENYNKEKFLEQFL
jgi:hypothetical protein